MTPLLGTKNPSAPAGNKSGAERRAARTAAFQVFTKHEIRNTAFFAVDAQGTHNQKPPPGTPCTPPARCFPARCGAAWGGYGAAWAAWATRAAASLFTIVHHCSRLFGIVQQKILRLSQCPLSVLTGNAACKVFTNHETRDKNHGLYAFHQTRDTAFFRIMAFFRVGRPLMREGGRSAGFKGGCTKRCVNEWKGVYLNPERKITTFSESRFGSRFGIPHYSSEFVGKIRISPCRQSSVLEHCGNRGITNHGFYAFLAAFLRVVTRRGTAWGGYGAAWAAAVPRAGNTAGKVFTNHGFFRMFRPSGGEKCSLLQGRSWALGRRLTREAVKRYDGELCRDIS